MLYFSSVRIYKSPTMRKSILLVLLLISLQGYSQIKAGLNIKPEVSFANSELYWISCSYGLSSNFNIYKWFSVNAGIGYQAKSYDLTKMPYTTDHDPISNYVLHTIPFYIMPKMNVLTFGKTFKIYGIAGVTMNSSLYSKTIYLDENSPEETCNKISFYNLLISIGCGLEYNISIFSISLEPAFNTVVASNSNFYHPYSNTVSLNMCCLYNFKNK